MQIEKPELERALYLFFKPGDVFEIRVLDAVSRAYSRPHIESGYFDYDHISAVAGAIAHISSAKGVYVTVNPVKPELLNRAVNRVRPAGREPTTADGDIVCRRWLLIDCDAVRASGIPSSDEEHRAAYEKAIEIKEGFASMGWTDPLVTDSGNGAQLMYRVDLPTADGNLVHSVLKSVSAVSSPQVDIDITVHNPARIWRLPGTLNCKGDSTDARPHRMARILSVPDPLGIVSEVQLHEACKNLEPEPVSVPSSVGPGYLSHDQFDLDSWIAQHCTGISGPMPWKDGRKWIFDVCPFNSEHTNRSAVITQLSNGAISFTCHHNGCRGNDWAKLRDMLDPGHDSRNALCTDVDMSVFLEKIKEKKIKRENPFEDPGNFPAHLLSIPGIVDDIIKLDLKTAPYPNKVLAFSGALAMMSFLIGRKIRDRRNNFSNLYMIALAHSGTGKDHPRKVNIALAMETGINHMLSDSFASGAGLEDSMFSTPIQLFQMDEVDWLFNTLKGAKDAAISESINEKLLKFFSASNSVYSMRKKAIDRNNSNADKLNQANIVCPSLTLFGTAVPDYFYESLSRRVLENGLVARCLIIEADKRGRHGTSAAIQPNIPEDLRDRIKFLAEIPQNDDYLGSPSPLEIPETPEATELLEKCSNLCDDFYSSFEAIHELSAMSLWARAMEKVYKLSMIHAFSVAPFKPCIDTTSVQWAFDFVSFVTKKMLFRAGQFCYESDFDKAQKKFLKLIADNGGSMEHSRLLGKMGMEAKRMRELVETLIDSEKIVISASRPRVYSIV